MQNGFCTNFSDFEEKKLPTEKTYRKMYPQGPARHLDASRQKLTPHCLAAIFDSQLPSLKLSLKMPPKLPLPHNIGHFALFQNCPRGEGNCAAIERQKLSRGKFCLAASRCLSGPSGYRKTYRKTHRKTEYFHRIFPPKFPPPTPPLSLKTGAILK